MQLSSEWRPWC